MMPAPVQPIERDAGPDDLDASTSPVDAGSPTNLRIARSASFDGYLTDGLGQPLYMFVGDVSDLRESACLGECAREWPPFDVLVAHPSAEIEASEVSRFHRQDGSWQTTYKGRGLYYRASEAGVHTITGDGVDGRWFVARDYLAFMSSARTFTPAGGMATSDSFLTDGFGRTLYVCLDDQPRTAISEAVSSCDAACSAKRPVFPAAATGRTTLLPSSIDPGELRNLVRSDGQVQVTYRGWPLYYYGGDIGAGSTEGHNERAWRAFDPVTFGIAAPPSD